MIDMPTKIGSKLFKVPENSGSLIATYDLIQTLVRFKMIAYANLMPYRTNVELTVWKGIYA
jgi:ubiquinone biosynthesis protein COQ9